MAIWSRLQGIIAGGAIGSAARDGIVPVLEPGRQNAWARRPFRVLAPNTAAQARAQGIASRVNLADDARRDGIGPERFNLLTEMARSYPDVAQALDLWRRGIIGQDEFTTALRRRGYPDEWIGHLSNLKNIVPPATDLIRMAVREVFSPGLRDSLDLDADFPTSLIPFGAALGISEATLRNYWAAHWDLPSYSQATEMLFRGELSPQEFRDLLRALDYAPKWRAKLEAIARRIPTTSDFQRLVRRGVYTPSERSTFRLDADYPDVFTEKMALHGMSEDDARDLWAGGWRTIPSGQLFRMLWRNIISPAELTVGLRALDYSPYWRPKLEEMAQLIPGRIDLRRFLAAGLIDRAQVKEGYRQLGYNEQHAEWQTLLAEKLAAPGDSGGGFVGRAQTQLWTTTHRSFLSGESSPTVAKNMLGRAGVPVAERDAVVEVWTRERELIRKQLTPAQIKKAYAKPVTNQTTGQPWTRDDAIAALVERGYTANDANEFLDI